uniref:Uncharacterized protein n=1 Tax=Avena sativa TaxID=4498 RepID=A0ACD5TS46_AVESA
MLLHLLFANPNRTLEQLQCLCARLYNHAGWDSIRHILLFCYKDLPIDCRRCLLYLSIYPPGLGIRRTCLVRRWVAEGLIARRAGISALDAAELCFNALLDRGLLTYSPSSACGRAKFIEIPQQVFQFIVERAIAAENSADLNLPPNFAPYLSPGNGIQLQQVPEERRPHGTSSCLWQSIGCSCKRGVPEVEPVVRRDIIWLLGLLPKFERQGLIKVLVLESLKGFQKYHLKNISQISELRYLNLRGTDVTELPEDIHKLYNLETLDIRQTKVIMLPPNIVHLRMIKHILSGNIDDIQQVQPRQQQQQQTPPPRPPLPPPPPRQQHLQERNEEEEEEDDDKDESDDEDEDEDGDEFDDDRDEGEDGDDSNIFGSYDPFSAVIMPHGIGHMTQMQVLSHVEISTKNFDKLITDLEHLQKLRKLGIILHGKMEPHIHNLLRAIEKLGSCLRSLSIRFKREAGNGNANDSINQITLPMFLQSIKLSGFRGGLPSCVLRPSQLVKVTLRESFLRNTDLRRLGQLANLSFLCLMFIRSYEGASHLVLKRYEYQNLKFLVLKQTFIHHLSVQEGAAPRLQNLQWTNSTVNTLSGINHLWRLTDIVFSGSIVSNGVRQAIAVDPRSINVVY